MLCAFGTLLYRPWAPELRFVRWTSLNFSHGRAPLKALVASAAFLIVLVVFGIRWLYSGEDVVSTYRDYAEAEQDGAVQRGWIPTFVPRSAREMLEVHNLDPNQQWIRFSLPEPDARAMARRMDQIAAPDEKVVSRRPPRWEGPWIPEPNDLPSGVVRFYRDAAPGLGARCLAIHWSKPITAYAWSC